MRLRQVRVATALAAARAAQSRWLWRPNLRPVSSYDDVPKLIGILLGLDAEDVVRGFVMPIAQVAGAGGESRPLPGPALQVYGSSRPLGRGPSVHRRAACRL